jgi:hypothetical protein
MQDNSEDALKFLEDLGLDLRKVVQGGGHSRPRTHTPSSGPVGATTMKHLSAAVLALPEVEVITEAKV